MNQRERDKRDRLDAARTYLKTTDVLMACASRAEAGELIWGAFVNALDAFGSKAT